MASLFASAFVTMTGATLAAALPFAFPRALAAALAAATSSTAAPLEEAAPEPASTASAAPPPSPRAAMLSSRRCSRDLSGRNKSSQQFAQPLRMVKKPMPNNIVVLCGRSYRIDFVTECHLPGAARGPNLRKGDRPGKLFKNLARASLSVSWLCVQPMSAQMPGQHLQSQTSSGVMASTISIAVSQSELRFVPLL
jgi:hypothetical protein